MDRRLLFPAVVVTAWAQQTSPATAEAERDLRTRAEQFYQLEVNGDFRHAEALVAEDTKDYYYNHDKPKWKNFRIDRVEFTDATHAKLTMTVTQVLRAPGIPPQDFSVPVSQDWKLENGEWVWNYVPTTVIDTPFGKWQVVSGDGTIPMPPGAPADVSSVQAMITIDRSSVELVAGSSKTETVMITNHLPGTVNLEIGSDRPKGLFVAVDKTQLGHDERAVVSFSLSGDAKPSGIVRISAKPLQEFLVQVRTK